MLNLRFVIAFAAVVREGSFTRAAQRLSTSQSWISEQVRKLEEQVGFQLLSRTSRKVELTTKGETFAKLAIHVVDSSEALDSYVRSTRETQQGRLRIGSVVTFSDLPERSALIDTFMRQHRRVEIEIGYGHQGVLLERLRRLELDVVMGFDLGSGFADEFDVRRVALLEGYLLLPKEDPSSGLKLMPMQAFADRSVVTLPRSSYGPMIDLLFADLSPYNVDWVPAPEDDRRIVERLARVRRLSSFRWRPPGQPRKVVGDMVQLPLEHPLTISAVLVRNRNLAGRNTDRLWRIAAEIAPSDTTPQPA